MNRRRPPATLLAAAVSAALSVTLLATGLCFLTPRALAADDPAPAVAPDPTDAPLPGGEKTGVAAARSRQGRLVVSR